MKESQWLKQYMKEVTEKRNQSNGNKKIIFIILPLMVIGVFVLAVVNGQGPMAENLKSALVILPVFGAIMLFLLLMLLIGKKKDVTKQTCNSVKALLRSDAEVEAFDRQMSMAPLAELQVSRNVTMFLTEDYLGKKVDLDNVTYAFVKRTDIAYCKKSKAGRSAGSLQASYFFDIRNERKEVIMNGLADSASLYNKLVELLKMARPGVQEL